MTQEQHEKKKVFLENQVKMLMDSFDNVEIFASSYDKSTGITDYWSVGDGNVYARKGQIRDWLKTVTFDEIPKDGEESK